MFLFKKKELVVEIYTSSSQLIDLFPPVKARSCLPDWYKTMPKGKDTLNVSYCAGFKDLYSQGIMLPLWCDHEIDLSPNGVENIRWPSGNNNQHGAIYHDLTSQAPGAFQGYGNVKFFSPWWMWCSEPVQWLWVQPMWNQKDPSRFLTIPGSTEFKNQNQININTIWELGTTLRTEKIKAGEPMVHLIPVTERPWTLKIDNLTNEILSKKFSRWHISFDKPYQRLRAEYDKRDK